MEKTRWNEIKGKEMAPLDVPGVPSCLGLLEPGRILHISAGFLLLRLRLRLLPRKLGTLEDVHILIDLCVCLCLLLVAGEEEESRERDAGENRTFIHATDGAIGLSAVV